MYWVTRLFCNLDILFFPNGHLTMPGHIWLKLLGVSRWKHNFHAWILCVDWVKKKNKARKKNLLASICCTICRHKQTATEPLCCDKFSQRAMGFWRITGYFIISLPSVLSLWFLKWVWALRALLNNSLSGCLRIGEHNFRCFYKKDNVIKFSDPT